MPIGPNQILPEQGPLIRRGPLTRSKPLPPITARPVLARYPNAATPYEPWTIIPTYPSTGQRLFNLIRGTFYLTVQIQTHHELLVVFVFWPPLL